MLDVIGEDRKIDPVLAAPDLDGELHRDFARVNIQARAQAVARCFGGRIPQEYRS